MKEAHIISLGAGVQSSTMALMAARGLITPMPECAIFADTQAEPRAVYGWLDWLEKELPFPVHRVTAGNLRNKSLRLATSRKTGKVYMKRYIPAYVLKPNGEKGLMGRTCTMDFKIVPLIRLSRQIVGAEKLRAWRKRNRKEPQPPLQITWLGISADEAHRMKPSREPWIEHRWPVIEVGMSREDCLEWMKANGYPEPPRSACTFCPFHGDDEWVRLEPDEFNDVVIYERELQEAARNQNAMTGIPFLHGTCQPIDRVRFKPGRSAFQASMFGNECEGMCNV